MIRNTFITLGLIAALLSSVPFASPTSAATRNWSGTTDDNWSVGGAGGNWTNAAIPTSADDVNFNETDSAGVGVTTNIVDASFPSTSGVSTIRTLNYLYTNTSPNFNHTTEITAGRTLLVTNGMSVASGTSTQAGGLTLNTTIRGGAGSALQVGNTGTNTANFAFGVASTGTSDNLTTTLDMSGSNRLRRTSICFK